MEGYNNPIDLSWFSWALCLVSFLCFLCTADSSHILLVMCTYIALAESLVCYNCVNVTDTTSCNTTTATCGADESCFMDRIPNGNTALFTLGCISNKQCDVNSGSGTAIIGRSLTLRQDQRCHECCSTDNCAVQLCSHQTPSACIDDQTLDCARMNSLFGICSDVNRAKSVCPHFCGLCNIVDGKWSSWTVWSSCSVTCENGTQSRTRKCNNPPPAHGGADCNGNSTELKQCIRELCPVNGGWTGWQQWGSCSVTCGVGIQRRLRSCTNPPPSRFGDHCFGVNIDDRLCFPGACEDGGWAGWNEWSSCSVVSGCIGFKTRSRSCSNPYPSSYGKYCAGNPMEIHYCATSDCPYQDCFEIKSKLPSARSGLYYIHLWRTHTKVQVYCNMEIDGGGWTVFQRRSNGSVSFYRTLAEYEVGFGHLDGEFWLGLKTIQEMAAIGKSELRIDLMSADGSRAYEYFQNFHLSHGPGYALQIDQGTGTAGDSRNDGLSYHNNNNFATNDHDVPGYACAYLDHGGWWYDSCVTVNLNARYEVPGSTKTVDYGGGGVIYKAFRQHESLKSTSMMFRRNK